MLRTTAPQSSGNKFIDADTSSGAAGTTIVAQDMNAHQEEIVKLIEEADITLSSLDNQASIATGIVAAEAILPKTYTKGVIGEGFKLSISGNVITASRGVAVTANDKTIVSKEDINLDIEFSSSGNIYVEKASDGKAILTKSTPSDGVILGTLTGSSGAWGVSESNREVAVNLHKLSDEKLKKVSSLSNANSYAHYSSYVLDSGGLTLIMRTASASEIPIEIGQGIIFTHYEDVSLTSAQRILPVKITVQNSNGFELISGKTIKLKNDHLPAGNLPQNSVFQAYYRGDHFELSTVLPHPTSTVAEGSNNFKNAGIIYPDWYIESIGNALYPVGTDYVQYPKITIGGTLYHGLTPADRKLPGTWFIIFGTTGAFFRTDGGNAGSFDAAVEQSDMIEAHHHLSGIRYNPDGVENVHVNGIVTSTPSSIDASIKVKDLVRSLQGRSFIATQNTGGVETRPINYTMRIWRRIL